MRWFLATLLFSTSSLADDLGRLFTNANQRAELDRAREQTSALPKVTLQGIVRRKGHAIVWLNGHPATLGQTIDGVKLVGTTEAGGTFLLPGRRNPIALKPGQSWEHDSVADLRRDAEPKKNEKQQE